MGRGGRGAGGRAAHMWPGWRGGRSANLLLVDAPARPRKSASSVSAHPCLSLVTFCTCIDIDTNRDGVVDVEELRAALTRKFGRQVGDELVTNAIAALDLRKDSVVAEDEWEESLAGLLGRRHFSEFELRTRELGPDQKYFDLAGSGSPQKPPVDERSREGGGGGATDDVD